MTSSYHPTHPRLEGLDFARFVAFFGMVLVNFRLVISGDIAEGTDLLNSLISLLEGKAAATFIVLAGIGLGLGSLVDKQNRVVLLTLKRSMFLLVLGLLNMLEFEADILHYYAFYFMFGALLLSASNTLLTLLILLLNVLSVVLMFILNYETGWDWTDFSYSGFWTVDGFIRNLIFNGWHPIIPWLSFLVFGLILSRLTLAKRKTQVVLILSGAVTVLVSSFISQQLVPFLKAVDPELIDLASTSAIPPMPLFIATGLGSAAVVVGLCLLASNRLARSGVLAFITPAGRQSLTLYLAHIFIGMGTFELFGLLGNQPVSIAFSAAVLFCTLSVLYAKWWSRYFKRGPLEALMRRVAG